MPNVRIIAKGQRGDSLTKLKVNFTPTQSGTPWQSDEVNNAPYVFRSVPMGNREWNKLVGGTVAWNQLANTTSFTNNQTDSRTYISLRIQSRASGSVFQLLPNVTTTGLYEVIFSSSITTSTGFYVKHSGSQRDFVFVNNTTNDIISGHKYRLLLMVDSLDLTTVGGLVISVIAMTDLTAMFNPTIADYVYSLEQATAGSGIAWLKKYDLIDDNYHAYSQGSLESVNVSAHVMRDADNNIIETYPTDSSVTLRGIPKKDADGNLYYDGDEYLPDGTVKRKYGTITVDGTENWLKSNSYPGNYYISSTVPNASGLSPNIVNNYTPNIATSLTQLSNYDRCVMFDGGSAKKNLNIKNSDIASVADFKTWLSANPIELVYKLVTETTESADPYTALQVCDPDGTEEYIDYGVEQGTRDYAVPVGHESTYAMAYPIEGVDSFTVTANDGTTHTYPVTLSEEIYRGYVDMLTGEAVSDIASIAEYNGETISEPWLSSLDVYSAGATPTNGAQVVYPITPEEVTATITGDPTELGKVTSVSSTEGTVEWSQLAPLDGKCIVRVVS